MIDVYPILRRLPDYLLPIRKEAKDLHKVEYDIFTGLFRDAKEQLREGKTKVCLTKPSPPSIALERERLEC